ncbi:MAG: 2-dehydropantoate 2-reductase [Solirubrobacteraceae bacterium]
MPERICIVGCGAIGAFYAAHLAQLADLEVWAYDVAAEHVAAINRNGLRLIGAQTMTATVHARTDASEIPPCPIGIVATKGTFTAAACAATEPVFTDAAVCSVQNGIGNEELIAHYAPRVMRGVTLPAGRIAAPGVIEVDAVGPTWIGPFEPAPASDAELHWLGERLNAAGLTTIVRADARGPQWTKLLFNSATNPLCALTGLTHGELCDFPPTRRLAGELVAEGRAVADALGIGLEEDPEALIDAAARENHQHRPSMLQDVTARRPTEIETLNGGIVAAGVAGGAPTPLHEAVQALIRGLERSWTAGSVDGA